MVEKYEYKIKFEQMKTLTAEGDYEAAAEIADTIQWRRVKNINLLIKAGDIYFKLKRYDDAKEILQMAYDRTPIGRMIIYRLAEIAVKTKNFKEAKSYYEEFVEIAPHDNLKYVLRYKISKAKGADLLTRIAILEELKEAEYTEEWAFELAYLYHKAGEYDKCIDTCDELILWFGDGIYVERALELKMLHKPLTQTQEDKYRACRQYRDGVKEVYPQKEAVQIPVVEEHIGKFDTSKLQEEIKKDFEQIIKPEGTETAREDADTIDRMVQEFPFLQKPLEEHEQQERQEQSRTVQQGMEQKQPEYAKPHAVQSAEDIMDLLADVIPQGDTGIKIPQSAQEEIPLQDSQPVQKRGRLHMDNRIRRPGPSQEEDTTESDLLRKIKRAKPRFQEQLGERRYIPRRVRQPGGTEQFVNEQPEVHGGYAEPLRGDHPETYEGYAEWPTGNQPEGYGGYAEPLRGNQPEGYGGYAERPGGEQPETYGGYAEPLREEQPETYGGYAETPRGNQPEAYGGYTEPLRGEQPEGYGGYAEPLRGEHPEIYGGYAEPLRGEHPEIYGGHAEPLRGEHPETYGGYAESFRGNGSKDDSGYAKPPREEHPKTYGGYAKPLQEEHPEAYGGYAKPFREEHPEAYGGYAKPFREEQPEAYGGYTEPLRGEQPEGYGGYAEPLRGEHPEGYGGYAESFGGNGSKDDSGYAKPPQEEHPETHGGYAKPLQEEQPEAYGGYAKPPWEEHPETHGGYAKPFREEQPEAYGGYAKSFREEQPQVHGDYAEPLWEEQPEAYGEEAGQPAAEVHMGYGRHTDPVRRESSERYTVHSEIIDTESYEEYEAEPDISGSRQKSPEFKGWTTGDEMEELMAQEEMRMAEAEFFGMPVENLPNQPEEETQQGSLVDEMLARQDTKEIKTKQIEEALDKHAVEMLAEEETIEMEGIIGAEPESLPEITTLDEEMASIFSYFVPVAGMEGQICKVLTNTLGKFMGQKTSSEDNILIQGGRGCGKTILARRLVKALKKESQRKDIKIGSIDAEKLNQKDLSKLLEKVSGGCLVVERAGEITRETAIKMSLLLENDDTGILVIMEDTRVGLEEALKKDEEFAKMFTQRIIIPVFTSDELVEFGKAYAHERNYEIDNMGVLALYNRISNIQRLDQPTTLIEIKDIIDEAIEKAEKKSWKKAFSILTSRRYTENDYIILKEKDFEE